MSKRSSESEPKSIPKKVKIHCPSFKYYNFSDIKEFRILYPDIVPRENLFGCAKMLTILENEIRQPLIEPEKYEFFSSSGVGLPLNRCLHFYGVCSSSKRTTVLAFAQQEKMKVLELQGTLGLVPDVHIPNLYKLAQSQLSPVIVLLRNFSELIGNEFNPHLHSDEVGKRQSLLYFLSQQLDSIVRSRCPVWTIFLSDKQPSVDYSVDKFFTSNTYWNCTQMELINDFFTDIDRCLIIRALTKRYCGNSEIFPFDEQELLMFCFTYTKYCTYRQIDTFLRSVFSHLKLTNSELTKDTFADYIKAREMVDVGFYPSYAGNIAPFVKEK